VPREAHAWGPATHAYIADHVGKQTALANVDEIYGAMAPDAFNTHFELLGDSETAACIRNHTHGDPLDGADDFLDVWNHAGRGRARNAAYGYATHNDLWGADYFAHWASPNGNAPGYLVAKAYELEALIDSQKDSNGSSPWDLLGIPPNPDPGPDPLSDPPLQVSDFIVQQAGEILIKRADPSIGSKVTTAALLRSNDFESVLLSDLSLCGLDQATVMQAEDAWRRQLMTLGVALNGSEAQVIDALTASLVSVAPAYLEAVTGEPFDPSLLPLVQSVVSSSLVAALSSIEPDYLPAIESIIADLPGVAASHGVSY
jgi:hypothetical protein